MNMLPTIKPTLRPSRLGAAQRGRKRAAHRIFLYSEGGLGKSTLASQAPRPIFIDVNQGSQGFDVARYTFDDDGRTKPESFDEVLQAVGDIARNGVGTFDTLVIDVLCDVEQLIWSAVVSDDKGKVKSASIEDVGGGFQKGYVVAVDYWRRLVAALEDCWRAGINVVLLDHADVKKEKNAAGADYGRFMPKVHPFAAKFLHTWSDCTIFIEIEKTMVPDSPDTRKAKKEYAVSEGKRILHARPAAEWLAKSRPELPDPLELPHAAGWAMLETEMLRASISARIGEMSPEHAEQARAAIDRAGDDAAKLSQLDNWCADKARKE